jgi:hypothetical protein
VCQAVSVGAFPVAAPSRAQYGPQLRALAVYLVEEQLLPLGRVQRLLTDLVGAGLGRGTLGHLPHQIGRVQRQQLLHPRLGHVHHLSGFAKVV